MMRRGSWIGGGLAVVMACGAVGCVAEPDEGERFREAIPQGSDVALAVPGSRAQGGSSPQDMDDLRIASKPMADPPLGTTSQATFYQFTRDVADGVDYGTAAVLGAVWLIVHTKPTSLEPKKATWGPGRGSALDPVVWRFTVTEVGDREYDYKLEGRPHTSESEADFLAVLQGHGWGKTHPKHRLGSFVIDHDAYRTLEPRRGQDSGTTKVSFDATKFPVTIQAEVKHTADPEWFNVLVTHAKDKSGSVDLTAYGDIDTPDDGTYENVALRSRWNPEGAGRADVQMSGGSLPTTVLASECWSASFARNYYTDNVNYQPTEGDPASCAFEQAEF